MSYEEIKKRPDNKERQEAQETGVGNYGGEETKNDELRQKTMPNTETP